MSEQNKQVVVKFIEAMGKSDAAAAAICLAPDATTLAKGFSKFAGIRHYDRIIVRAAAREYKIIGAQVSWPLRGKSRGLQA